MSTYSTNLKIELIGTGEQVGTWGTTTNSNFSNVFEQSIVGRVTVNFATDANKTLSASDSVASQDFRNVYLNLTSSVSLGATRDLIVPTINKNYIVQNNTTGSQSIRVITAAGTGITVPNGSTGILYVDGTNVIQAFDYLPTLTVPTLNVTTLDLTNIEVTNIKAKDGTASASIADSTGAFTVSAPFATTGNTTLGNASGDTVTVTGTITSNLIFTDNTYDIGASGATRPRNLYLAGDATIGGSVIATTLDLTNLEVTNIKAKDGTASASIADSTGAFTVSAAFAANGSVTLGDASTDTVTVNGYIGVGGAGSAGSGLLLSSSSLTGSNQKGIYVTATASSGATGSFNSIATAPATAAASFTVPTLAGFVALDASKGAGSTITNQYGLYIADQTQGTTNSGIISLVSSGSNKWNIYASGTASNYFAGNVGIGTSSPGGPLHISSANALSNFYIDSTNALAADNGGTILFRSIATGTSIYPMATITGAKENATSGNYAGYLSFSTKTGANVLIERMRIDSSGNVGIGTGSPQAKLSVSNAGVEGFEVSPAIAIGGVIRQIAFNRSTSAYIPMRYQASEHQFYNATTSVALIDSSGNLGLGVTPSAWGSSYKAFEIRNVGNAVWSSAANDLKLVANVYHNGTSYTYANTAAAARYDLNNGSHYWYNAPSGIPGNTITFTQAMTLDANGKLLVGATSAVSSEKAQIRNDSNGATSNVLRLVNGGTSVSTGSRLLFGGYTNSTGYVDFAGIEGVSSASTTGYLSFSTSISGTYAERMRIDSSGNLGLGVTPSAWGSTYDAMQLGTSGAIASSGTNTSIGNNWFWTGSQDQYINTAVATRYRQNAGSHIWDTAASGTAGTAITFTQAMTLDASGNLGVGTTAPKGGFAYNAATRVIGIAGDGTASGSSYGALNLDNNRATPSATDTFGIVAFTSSNSVASRTLKSYITGTSEGAGGVTAGYGGAIAFYTQTDNTAGALPERLRITNDGYIRLTANSSGIQFNGDTAAANALNDYEEGTFTPTIVGTTTAGTGTYTTQTGNYTKIGNLVTATVRLVWSAHTGTGNMRISGLPFAAVTNPNGYQACWTTNLTVTGQTFVNGIAVGGTTVEIVAVNNGASAALAMDTAATVFVTFQYWA